MNPTPTRLVQIAHAGARRVALVDEPHLRLLDGVTSLHQLADAALGDQVPLAEVARARATGDRLEYDEVYAARGAWRLLPPVDHPSEPARCLVSGTGLTHLGSAANRNAMHGRGDAELTDSMRMFRLGLEEGRPAAGRVGAAPEWFYKGTGTTLRACGEPLDIPPYAEDGGEEAEIAGVYLIDRDGQPRRVGLTAGNEFSDHRFEKRNYLNLAGSKLRTCAIGPEIVVDAPFEAVHGVARIERSGAAVWERAIATGESEMCHSLANIEHHHFKFEAHRRPGDVHVHFFGAHSLSFGDGIALEDGDIMIVRFDGFGRSLWNPVRVATRASHPVTVVPA